MRIGPIRHHVRRREGETKACRRVLRKQQEPKGSRRGQQYQPKLGSLEKTRSHEMTVEIMRLKCRRL